MSTETAVQNAEPANLLDRMMVEGQYRGAQRVADTLVRLLEGARADILDAGCGPGRVGAELARRGHDVTHSYVEGYVSGKGRLEAVPGETITFEGIGGAKPVDRRSSQAALGRARMEVEAAELVLRSAARRLRPGRGEVRAEIRGGRSNGQRAPPRLPAAPAPPRSARPATSGSSRRVRSPAAAWPSTFHPPAPHTSSSRRSTPPARTAPSATS